MTFAIVFETAREKKTDDSVVETWVARVKNEFEAAGAKVVNHKTEADGPITMLTVDLHVSDAVRKEANGVAARLRNQARSMPISAL